MPVSEDRVQIGKRGTMTLPAALRKRYGLDAGDLLTVIDLGGIFVLSPEVSVVSKIAREIEQMREEAVRVEAERNLIAKLPHALPAYRALLRSAKLREVPLPSPDQLRAYRRQADPKDLPHLVSACLAGCHYLVTHNTRHYAPKPGTIEVLNPGAFLERIRLQLSQLVP